MEDEDMPGQPRICFVSRKWPPAMGGMETYAWKLTKALEDHVEVDRIVLPGQTDGSVPGSLKLLGFGVTTALRLLFQPRPAPVTHVADMASWPLGLCAKLRSPKSQIVLSAHGTDVSYPLRGGVRGHLYAAYLRLGARLLRSAKVIANSSATADCAERFGFRRPDVIALAAEGPDISPGAPNRSILFSGRLVRRKGARWFVENVLPLLPEDIELEIAGTVWASEENEILSHPRVRYVGRLDQEKLWQAYAKAICVVVPNIELENGEFEGFGLVATEAAVAGGVALASRHAGLVEAVLEGKTGFLLTPGDAQEWAQKISEVAAWSAEERRTYVSASQKASHAYYIWSRVAEETLSIYALDDACTAPQAGAA